MPLTLLLPDKWYYIIIIVPVQYASRRATNKPVRLTHMIFIETKPHAHPLGQKRRETKTGRVGWAASWILGTCSCSLSKLLLVMRCVGGLEFAHQLFVEISKRNLSQLFHSLVRPHDILNLLSMLYSFPLTSIFLDLFIYLWICQIISPLYQFSSL